MTGGLITGSFWRIQHNIPIVVITFGNRDPSNGKDIVPTINVFIHDGVFTLHFIFASWVVDHPKPGVMNVDGVYRN